MGVVSLVVDEGRTTTWGLSRSVRGENEQRNAMRRIETAQRAALAAAETLAIQPSLSIARRAVAIAERSLVDARRNKASPLVLAMLKSQVEEIRRKAKEIEREAERRTAAMQVAAAQSGNAALSAVLKFRSAAADRRSSYPDKKVSRALRTVELSRGVPIATDQLTPNTRYKYGTTSYVTDDHGRTAVVEGMLRPTKAAPRHPIVQRAAGKLSGSGSWNDVGGHFIAVSLGGAPSGPNLFPQDANFNVSAFASYENLWRNALSEGKEVQVRIEVAEGTVNADRPDGISLWYQVSGEEPEELYLLNEPHQLKSAEKETGNASK